MIKIKNNNILVLGLGVSGYESAKFLARKGANVYVSEKNSNPKIDDFARELKEKFNCRIEIGGHTKDFCRTCESAIISPGIDPASDDIKIILPLRIDLISEIELASLFSPAFTVAVTGTNGKSTTVELIHRVVSLSGKKSVLCGNIGTPYIGKIDDMDKDTVAVVEISSFQLEKIITFKPNIAVILNITDDHYERHKDYKTYKREKYKIFKNHDKNDWLIINESLKDDDEIKAYTGNLVTFGFSDDSIVTIKENLIISSIMGKKERIFDARGVFLKGRHNIENIMAVAGVCHIMGVNKKYINDGIKSFKGLSHRFETIAEFNGISYIDDSKATNVDGALMALRSLNKDVILIAGGIDKGGDYTPLIDIIRDKVKLLILIGEAKDKLFSIFGSIVKTVKEKSMDNAVETAVKNAVKGDSVLLSPMCSSFDMFRDYKDRGDKFKNAVQLFNDK